MTAYNWRGWACRGGKLGVARALLKAGASPAARNRAGETSLEVAGDSLPKLVELFEPPKAN